MGGSNKTINSFWVLQLYKIYKDNWQTQLGVTDELHFCAYIAHGRDRKWQRNIIFKYFGANFFYFYDASSIERAFSRKSDPYQA